MIGSLLKECKFVKVENSAAAGTGTVVGEIVDTAGYGGACFVYKLGAVTDAGVVTLKVYQGSNATVTDVAELTGASAAIAATSSDSEQMLVVDVILPRERYLRPSLIIADQTAEIDWGMCILYNPRVIPVTQTAAVDDDALVVSPAEV